MKLRIFFFKKHQLYDSISPKLTGNFKEFLKGTKPGPLETTLGYKDTLFSRMIPSGWVQGGEIMDPKGKVFEGDIIEGRFYIQVVHTRKETTLTTSYLLQSQTKTLSNRIHPAAPYPWSTEDLIATIRNS
jgi:hypothetical protein